jgi:hypothetical protein
MWIELSMTKMKQFLGNSILNQFFFIGRVSMYFILHASFNMKWINYFFDTTMSNFSYPHVNLVYMTKKCHYLKSALFSYSSSTIFKYKYH